MIRKLSQILVALALLFGATAAGASQNTCTLPTSGTLSGLTLVTTLNSCHDSIMSEFSGASAPSSPIAFQLWNDTTNNVLKIRNSGNTAWLILGQVGSGTVGYIPFNGGVSTNAPSSTGSANAYVITYSPAATAYVTGQRYAWVANFANTGAATVNINSLGAKNITKKGTAALAANDILSGQVVEVVYDGTQMQLVSSVSSILDGSGGSLSGALNGAQGTDIASAATTNLCTATGNYVHVTGTVTITAFGTCQAGTTRIVRFTGALTLTHNGTSLILPTAANIVTFADDRITAVSLGSGNWIVTDYTRASGLAVGGPVMRGYIDGCIMANNGTDANNDIDITACQATDDTNVFLMSGAALTKRMDATWTVGNNGGGLDTGTEAASTWYHVYEIRRPDTGVVDYLFSTSVSSPTMPTNYTQKRRIGSIFNTSGSAIRAFVQRSNVFLWNDLSSGALDFGGVNALGTTPTNFTCSVPTGLRILAKVRAGMTNSEAANTMIYSPDTADPAAPNATAFPLSNNRGNASQFLVNDFDIWTNTSAQVRAVSSAANTDWGGYAYGWTDPRGENQ